MSRRDFEDCTPSEFRASWDAWNSREERLEQAEWERVRWLALFILSPHSKRTLRARDIAVFPWEKKKKNNLPKDKISEEEMMKRYRAAMKRRGLR